MDEKEPEKEKEFKIWTGTKFDQVKTANLLGFLGAVLIILQIIGIYSNDASANQSQATSALFICLGSLLVSSKIIGFFSDNTQRLSLAICGFVLSASTLFAAFMAVSHFTPNTQKHEGKFAYSPGILAVIFSGGIRNIYDFTWANWTKETARKIGQRSLFIGFAIEATIIIPMFLAWF